MSNAPARLAAVTPNAPPTVTISPHIETLGPPSGFTCPDCGATRITLDEDYYRRRVGHAWTAAGLLHACDRQFENAVCVAVRSLKEARPVPTGAENSTRGDDGERY